VPPKNRPSRPTFGGKLLATPVPLPDDEAPPPQDVTPPAEEPPPAPAPTPAVLTPASLPQTPDHARPASPRPSRPHRERPPGTIRLDDRAGQALWEAYLEAKTHDPFLSYRQFASGIILEGLTIRRHPPKPAP
jgi:hypothetical protein